METFGSASSASSADTKRKYTVSAKVLAANRRNLEKANAVPKSVRYRATARRVASCYANLEKAQAAQRHPEHPGRRGPMAHGFQVVDLRRTALKAGERPEDLDRHRALFLEAFPGSRARSRLAQALADIFWRRWRALAWEAEREARQFYASLDASPEPSPGLTRAERETLRALDGLVTLAGLAELHDRLGQLNRRFERLARAWLYLHTDECSPDPQLMKTRISRMDNECLQQTEAVLSNPFLSSGQVARRLEQSRRVGTPRTLDPPEQWRPWGRGMGRAKVGALLAAPPADFEAHRARLAAAFGKTSEGGSAEVSSNSAAFLERAAQLSWQRLKLIGEHLEKEQKAVAELFEAKLDPAVLLVRLVRLLAGDEALMRRAHEPERELQKALYECLIEQEPAACYEALRPGARPPREPHTEDESDWEKAWNWVQQ